MKFHIRALSHDDLVIQLTIDANDELDARRQIEARGMFAADIIAAGNLSGQKTASRNFSLMLFNQELLSLLNAGLAIVESLEALSEKETNESIRSIHSRLIAGLHEGKRFSAVLAQQPELFPALYIGIVKAAESTSNLPSSLQRYINYQRQVGEVRNKIVSALIYPSILLCVGTGVSLFLIGYVVPRFAQVYEGSGHNLPWMSQALINWGRFATDYPAHLLAGVSSIAIAVFLGIRYLISHGGLQHLLRFIPSLSERLRIYELSRLYVTLGMLIEGGIPIVTALENVRDVISPAIKGKLQRAIEDIESGIPFSTAFEKHNLTTPISLRMLRVGERSGSLGAMLHQSASFYEGEINRWIDRFTRTFEPLLMAAIGIIVGAIVVLLYMPIFDLAESMS